MREVTGAHVALFVEGLEPNTFDLVLNQRAQLVGGIKIYEVQGGGIEMSDFSPNHAAMREMFEELQLERFYTGLEDPTDLLRGDFKLIREYTLDIEERESAVYLAIVHATKEAAEMLRRPFKPTNEVDHLHFHDTRLALPANFSPTAMKYFIPLLEQEMQKLNYEPAL